MFGKQTGEGTPIGFVQFVTNHLDGRSPILMDLKTHGEISVSIESSTFLVEIYEVDVLRARGFLQGAMVYPFLRRLCREPGVLVYVDGQMLYRERDGYAMKLQTHPLHNFIPDGRAEGARERWGI